MSWARPFWFGGLPLGRLFCMLCSGFFKLLSVLVNGFLQIKRLVSACLCVVRGSPGGSVPPTSLVVSPIVPRAVAHFFAGPPFADSRGTRHLSPRRLLGQRVAPPPGRRQLCQFRGVFAEELPRRDQPRVPADSRRLHPLRPCWCGAHDLRERHALRLPESKGGRG